MTASAEATAASTAQAGSAPRGRVWVCALAFALLLGSTYLQFSGAIGTGGLPVVWASIGLSVAAAVVAALAVLLPGKSAGSRALGFSEERATEGSRQGESSDTAEPADDASPEEAGEEPEHH